MNSLKTELKECLRQGGIPVEDAGAWQMGKILRESKAYVSLRQITGGQGAFRQYWGTDEQGNEIYGMQLTVKFALVLLTPKSLGAAGAEAFGEETLNTVLTGAGELGAQEILCTEARYDSLRDCFQQEISVESHVMACGTETDSGITLTGFRVKGTVL